MHYPAIAAIVEDEARKRGISYSKYATLPQIVSSFVNYMKEVGRAEDVGATTPAAGLARM